MQDSGSLNKMYTRQGYLFLMEKSKHPIPTHPSIHSLLLYSLKHLKLIYKIIFCLKYTQNIFCFKEEYIEFKAKHFVTQTSSERII